LLLLLLLLQGLAAGGQEDAVADYVKAASHKSERERSELQKDKTGVFTGGRYHHSTAWFTRQPSCLSGRRMV
jgi:leucyl-tRNA synthetase